MSRPAGAPPFAGEQAPGGPADATSTKGPGGIELLVTRWRLLFYALLLASAAVLARLLSAWDGRG